MTVYIFFVICVAFFFEGTNGGHDAANSIATVVSTKVLTRRQAVFFAAFFNLVACIFGTAVAKTVGKDLIDPSIITTTVILAALLGAIVWNLLTWKIGFPSSSSHALIGGLAGAAIAKTGTIHSLIASGFVKTGMFMCLAPLIGLLLGLMFRSFLKWILKEKVHSAKTDRRSRRVQLFTAALYSFFHGTNDAQKTMGVVTLLLFSSQVIPSMEIPWWVKLLSGVAMALGTLCGAWKIVHTMGEKIMKGMTPLDGSCAESAGAISIGISTALGIPVSTTHVITGAIAGVGTGKGKGLVYWRKVRAIILGWIFTIPLAASMAWGTYHLICHYFNVT